MSTVVSGYYHAMRIPTLPYVTSMIMEVPSARKTLMSVAWFTLVCNLLMLAPSIYMLQVYDRVLTSFDTNTLYALSILLLYIYGVLSALDYLRARALGNYSSDIEESYVSSVNAAITQPQLSQLMIGRYSSGELNNIKSFVASGPLLAIIDAPWAVIFVAVVFVIHPTLGFFTVGAALFLILLTDTSIRMTRTDLDEAQDTSSSERLFISDAIACSESIAAMGMREKIVALLFSYREKYNTNVERASLVVARIGTIAKLLRLMSQSSILGIGAYYAIQNEITAGGMIAASILAGRALQPVEGIIQVLKASKDAEKSASFVLKIKKEVSQVNSPTIRLPHPHNSLTIENLTLVSKTTSREIVKNISINLNRGEVLGLIGPSGSGKTTLLRLASGAMPPSEGRVLYDSFELRNWKESDYGKFIGYQSQSIELMAGSISHNISRFQAPIDDEVIRAAHLSASHTFISELRDGYDHRLGPHGEGLSEGQRKRLCLARAYYGSPSFIFLDEPSNALDDKSLQRLLDTLHHLREEGRIVIVVTHNPQVLRATQRTAVLVDGVIQMLDSTEKVIQRYLR